MTAGDGNAEDEIDDLVGELFREVDDQFDDLERQYEDARSDLTPPEPAVPTPGPDVDPIEASAARYELVAEMADLRAQVAQQAAELDERDRLLGELGDEIDGFRTQLEARVQAERMGEHARHELHEERRELQRVKALLEARDAERDELAEVARRLQADSAEATAQSAHAVERLGEVDRARGELAQTVARLEAARDAERAEHADRQHELNEARGEAHRLAEALSEVTQSRDQLARRAQQLESLDERRAHEISYLNRRIDGFVAKVEAAEALDAQIKSLDEQLTLERRRTADLNRELASATAESKAAAAAVEAIAGSQTDHDDLLARIAELEADLARRDDVSGADAPDALASLADRARSLGAERSQTGVQTPAEPAAAEPEPTDSGPEPVVAEPEPVVVEPAAEPEAVVVDPAGEPEHVAAEPAAELEPVVVDPAGEPEPVAAEPEPVAEEPGEEPAAEVAEPKGEPATEVAGPEVGPEPEPVTTVVADETPPPPPPPPPPPAPDPVPVPADGVRVPAFTVDEAIEVPMLDLGDLEIPERSDDGDADFLSEVTSAAEIPAPPIPEILPAPPPPPSAAAPALETGRRRRLVLPAEMDPGTPEAVQYLLGRPDVAVIVDARSFCSHTGLRPTEMFERLQALRDEFDLPVEVVCTPVSTPVGGAPDLPAIGVHVITGADTVAGRVRSLCQGFPSSQPVVVVAGDDYVRRASIGEEANVVDPAVVVDLT